MKIGAFIIGMAIASLATGIAGMLAGLGLWTSVALGGAVLVVSQALYALTLAIRAFGPRRDGGKREASRLRDRARALSSENMTQK